MVNIDNNDQATICTLIDGICASPPPFINENVAAVVLQSKHVGSGKHKIKTIINLRSTEDPLGSWEVNYTVYNRRLGFVKCNTPP